MMGIEAGGVQSDFRRAEGATAVTADRRHIDMLDGWRALSITLVMAGHLFWLSPRDWEVNEAAAGMGMVMFFTLSGFLITRFLISDGDLRKFLIRRVLRIVPLAWLGMALAFALRGGSTSQLIGSALFFANLPPFYLLPAGGHFWSLCLEVQFYVAIAALVAVGGQRALKLIPLICIAVTLLRISGGRYYDITTWYRLDEILAGATLALVYQGQLGARWQALLAKVNFLYLLPVLFLSSWPLLGPLCYVRPYLSAVMIGASLYNAPAWAGALSRSRPVKYLAQVSYALYVFHGIYAASWLGSGSSPIKYAKRPLLLAVTFACAHFSTFKYERFWIDMGRRLTRREAVGVPAGG